MKVDPKKFVCSECGSRHGLDMCRTAKGKAVWRCSLHRKDTESLPRPQRPSKEAS